MRTVLERWTLNKGWLTGGVVALLLAGLMLRFELGTGTQTTLNPEVLGAGGLFALHLLRQGNGGEARAPNTGAAQAMGTLLLFLDDDMEVLPGYVWRG